MNITSKLNSGSTYMTHNALELPRENVSHQNGRTSGAHWSWRRVSTALLVVPGVLLVSLFAMPLLALSARALDTNFIGHAFSTQALSALRLSLITSSLTVVITVLAGTPLAYILARWKFLAKPYLEMLIDLPIVLPPSVAGIALLIAFGRQGMFGPALGSFNIQLPFTAAAVVVAQIFVAAPLYVRAARIGFAEIDVQIEEAARVEGASQWQLFSYVMFPLAGRSLISGAILTLTRALGEFGATMLFAGNLEGVTQTMPMAIYLGFERNMGIAIALSMLLITISVILLGITRQLETRHVH